MIAPTDFDANGVPRELIAPPQWVCWRPIERGDKVTKLPLDPRTGNAASSTDPTTWSSFENAVATARRWGFGVGYVFSDDDPFTGLDLAYQRM